MDLITKFYKKSRLIILDLLLINMSLILSFFFRFSFDWINYWNYQFVILHSLFGFIIFYFSDLYNKIWVYVSIQELFSIIKTSVMINTLFIMSVYFFNLKVPRSTIILNGILTIFLLGSLRFFMRFLKDFLTKYKNGKKRYNEITNVIIVGAGDAGEMIVRELQKHPGINKKIIGLIDDDPYKQNLEIHGIEVLGNRKKIPEIIDKYDINEVIIAIPSAKGKEIKEIYELSNQEGVKVKTVPGIYEILNGGVHLNQIREVKVEDLLRREPVELNTENISSYVKDETILITGGGGSIGSEIVRQIARFEPENLILFDIYENNLYFLELDLKEKYKNVNIIPVIGSIRDKNKLEQVFNKHRPDVVFHAAAHKHVPLMEHNPEEAIKNNIFGTKKLAETAIEYNVKKFVSISTDKAVNPTNVMGASKRVSEMIIQSLNKESQTKFMAVRFGNVLGSHGSVIPLFKKQIANREPVTVTHPEIERYFMTIPEAAQLVIQAGALGEGGEVFVLDMGEPVKILDLARDLIRLSGLEPGVDVDIKITGLRPGEKLTEELTHDTEDSLETEHQKIFIQNLKIVEKEELKYMLRKLNSLVTKGDSEKIINTLVNFLDSYHPNREKINKNLSTEEEDVNKVIGEIAVSKENS